MGFTSNVIKELDNEFAYIAADEKADEVFYDSGSYALNALLSGSIFGGMPGNSITGIAGEFQTGKTYFSLSIAKNFQATSGKAEVIMFDSEKNPILNGPALNGRGIDAKRFGVLPVATIQEFRTQVSKINASYAYLDQKNRIPLLTILDSLGNLSTTKEIEDIREGNDKRDMTRAQAIRGTFRALTLEMGKLQIPMIVTNHTYQVIGSYFPETDMGGGEGLKYAASTIIFLSSAKDRNATTKEVTGAVITCTSKKSRYVKPFNKVQVLLNYETGIDRYYGLADLAVEAGLWKKAEKGWTSENSERVSQKYIDADPTAWFKPELLKKIDEYVGKKFKYGTDAPKDSAEAIIQETEEKLDQVIKDVKEVVVGETKKRGRPRKEAAPVKRGRGRPKKNGN